MKKVAVTVAVLALGLAACAKNDAANNDMTANDTYTENAAESDLNTSMNAAENALENAGNAVENASDAVENAADNAADATTNS
jgi:outer membrane lipoprotein SlyB